MKQQAIKAALYDAWLGASIIVIFAIAILYAEVV